MPWNFQRSRRQARQYQLQTSRRRDAYSSLKLMLALADGRRSPAAQGVTMRGTSKRKVSRARDGVDVAPGSAEGFSGDRGRDALLIDLDRSHLALEQQERHNRHPRNREDAAAKPSQHGQQRRSRAAAQQEHHQESHHRNRNGMELPEVAAPSSPIPFPDFPALGGVFHFESHQIPRGSCSWPRSHCGAKLQTKCYQGRRSCH